MTLFLLRLFLFRRGIGVATYKVNVPRYTSLIRGAIFTKIAISSVIDFYDAVVVHLGTKALGQSSHLISIVKYKAESNARIENSV